ncbi:MAG: Holliday junction resolvase RuvX [Terriglobales bacterium]
MSEGRVLAVDYGTRRMGLAVSDELGITAQGLATLVRRNRRSDLAALRTLAQQYEARRWVVGLPRLMSGDEGGMAAEVRAWGAGLERATGVVVEYWDERLTTREAGRVLQAAGASRSQAGRAVDKMAAVILLQSYLDAGAIARLPL